MNWDWLGELSMNIEIPSINSNELLVNNYIEYSKYVADTRAYPDIVDGMKTSYRRCIHQIYKGCPRHMVKSSKAIGEVVVAHPHPSSIYGVLVQMTQPDGAFPVFDGQGNFGSKIPPSGPAAVRYTELMLSDLSIKLFESFSDSLDMVEGEMIIEPKRLASYLPLSLLTGSSGIPVGLKRLNDPALNPVDLVDYAIELMKGNKNPNILVKPNIGNVLVKTPKSEWKKLLESGEGKCICAPNMVVDEQNRKITVTGIPEEKDFTHLVSALQEEIDKDQIDVRDETTKEVCFVVEILPHKKVNIKDLAKKVDKALTKTVTYKFIFCDNGYIIYCGIQATMLRCQEYLKECCKKSTQTEINEKQKQLDVLEIIELMKKDGSITKLSKMTKNQAIEYIVKTYETNESIAKGVLSKPISYLTKEHDKEIKDLKSNIKELKNILKDINSYLITQYEELKESIKLKMKGRKMTKFSSNKKLF